MGKGHGVLVFSGMGWRSGMYEETRDLHLVVGTLLRCVYGPGLHSIGLAFGF